MHTVIPYFFYLTDNCVCGSGMLAINRILLKPVAISACHLVGGPLSCSGPLGKIQSCTNWAQHCTNSGLCSGKYVRIYSILTV